MKAAFADREGSDPTLHRGPEPTFPSGLRGLDSIQRPTDHEFVRPRFADQAKRGNIASHQRVLLSDHEPRSTSSCDLYQRHPERRQVDRSEGDRPPYLSFHPGQPRLLRPENRSVLWITVRGSQNRESNSWHRWKPSF